MFFWKYQGICRQTEFHAADQNIMGQAVDHLLEETIRWTGAGS